MFGTNEQALAARPFDLKLGLMALKSTLWLAVFRKLRCEIGNDLEGISVLRSRCRN